MQRKRLSPGGRTQAGQGPICREWMLGQSAHRSSSGHWVLSHSGEQAGVLGWGTDRARDLCLPLSIPLLSPYHFHRLRFPGPDWVSVWAEFHSPPSM